MFSFRETYLGLGVWVLIIAIQLWVTEETRGYLTI